jgi:hypothetical protein
MTAGENRLRIARDIVDRVSIGKGRVAAAVPNCGGKRLRSSAGVAPGTKAPRGVRVG